MSYELGLLRNPDYKLNQTKCRTFFGSFLHPAVPGGYPASYAEVIKFYAELDSLPRDTKIIVVDDLFLEETTQLLAEGFTNITLVAKEDNKANKIPNICYMTMQIRLASVVYNKEKVSIRLLKEDEAVQEKFDLCIMNPPFSVAPDVIKSGLDIADKVVCLAPLSKFKKNKAYQHVEKYEVIDAEAFEDATLTDNLIIATLSKSHHNSASWDEFQIESTNPKYKDFYSLNATLPWPYWLDSYTVNTKISTAQKFNPLTDFLITMRTVLDGTHSDEAYDCEWNLKKSLLISDIAPDKKHPERIQVGFLSFHSPAEHNNLCRFWYNNENALMDKLLKGLNKQGGRCSLALPRINWSVDRDYEHLTYEDLLKIMKEEK